MSAKVWLEMFNNAMREKLAQSFAIQSRAERKARLEAVIALSVELARIRAVNVYRTGIAETVIADIIEGDWEGAEIIKDEFADTSGVDPRCADAWTNFHTILTTACAEAKRRGRDAFAPPRQN